MSCVSSVDNDEDSGVTDALHNSQTLVAGRQVPSLTAQNLTANAPKHLLSSPHHQAPSLHFTRNSP